MLLHDTRIRELLPSLFPDHHEVLTTENRVQPASVDLTVKGPLMKVHAPDYGDEPIRPGKSEMREVGPASYGWVLRPGFLYLLSTREKIVLPGNLVGRLDGRSSWGRVGLRVHATAGFLDPGFTGLITLELDVVGPSSVELREGDSICQVSFHTLLESAEVPYGVGGSKYQGQTEVTLSRDLRAGNSR